jgi:hypothetical protein
MLGQVGLFPQNPGSRALLANVHTDAKGLALWMPYERGTIRPGHIAEFIFLFQREPPCVSPSMAKNIS